MPATWIQFYENRVNDSYYSHVRNRYGHFINAIRKELTCPKVVVELGCGICNVTRALVESHPYNKYYAVDNNPVMLDLSRKNLQSSDACSVYPVELECGDILEQTWTGDLAHSHGVLEHFSDKDIRSIVANQKRYFKTSIHYVPSFKYGIPSFGDERLLTPEEWQAICQPNEIIEFNDGYDLILKFIR